MCRSLDAETRLRQVSTVERSILLLARIAAAAPKDHRMLRCCTSDTTPRGGYSLDQNVTKPAANSGSPDGTEASIVDAPTADAQAAFLAETSAHSLSTRRWWIGAGVVATLVALVGVGWWLWPDAGQDSPPPATQNSSIATASPVPPAAQVATATVSTPTAGQPPTSPAPGDSDRPGSAVPGSVAAQGEPLTEIVTPPEKTIGLVVVPKGFTEASYSVVFEPYGWGPGGQTSGRLAARIISAKPMGSGARALDQKLEGRNVSVWASSDVASVLTVGGRYEGVVEIRPQGDVGTLYLTSAERVR